MREDIAPEADDQGLAVLRDAIAQFRPALIIMDTLAALLAIPNENDNFAVTSVMRRLGRTASDFDCAILLLHHTPKMTRETAAAQRGEPTLVRGGRAIGNSARVVVTITSPPGKEAQKFALVGKDPLRIRRFEHAKINDLVSMDPAYFETTSVDITTNNSTVVAVRAIRYLSSLPTAGGTSN